LDSPLWTGDLDRDGYLDLIFVDRKSRLVCVYDMLSYWKKVTGSPQFFNCRHQDATLLRLAYLNRLREYHAYDRLDKELASSSFPGWEHSRLFYQALCALSQGKDASGILQKCVALVPAFSDAQFLQAVVLLNEGKKEEASKLLTQVIQKNSILDFHRVCQWYGYLLSQKGQDHLRTLRPSLIQKTQCDLQILQAYQYALFTNRQQEASCFLELSLRYGLPISPEYEKRAGIYLDKISELLKSVNTLYSQHKSLDILDHALEVLPDHPELLHLKFSWGKK
jgi:hypothetical protein